MMSPMQNIEKKNRQEEGKLWKKMHDCSHFKGDSALEKSGTYFEYIFLENVQLNELPDTINTQNQRARDVLNKTGAFDAVDLVE